MKKRNFWAILLSIVMIFTSLVFAGCIKPEADKAGNRVAVKVFNFNGGVGTSWLEAAAERFMDENKEREFESGKVGVYIDITPEKGLPLDTLSTRKES